MPVYAVGSKTGLAYVPETTFGVIPTTPAMKALRAKFGAKLELKRNTFSSKEVTPTRQVISMAYGNRSGSGSLPIEFGYGSFDDFLEALMGGTWTGNVLKVGNVNRSFLIEDQTSEIGVYEQNTGVVFSGLSLGIKPDAIVEGSFDFLFKDQRGIQSILGATTLAIAATTLTRSAGSFITDGFAIGDVVVVSGAGTVAGNQTPAVITGITATVITCSGAAWTVLAATANLTVSLGSLVNATGGTNTPASTVAPFDAFTGTISEGGTVIAYITGLDLKLVAAAQANNIVFNATAQSITLGVVGLTGNLSVYFVNQALKQKFLNGIGTSLQFTLGNGIAQSYTFNMGTVKYTSNSRDDQENTITESIGFTAIYDTTDASTLKITRIP
jgi:hypothetical protein